MSRCAALHVESRRRVRGCGDSRRSGRSRPRSNGGGRGGGGWVAVGWREDRAGNVLARQGGGDVELAVSCYELIGVGPHYSIDRIEREINTRVRDEADGSFSDATIALREAVLRQAEELLTVPRHRIRYDEKSFNGNTKWSVPLSLVPGCLVLLLEDGRFEEVISIGENYVHKLRTASSREDIALAVAMARFERARETTYGKSASLDSAGKDLDSALTILRKHASGKARAVTMMEQAERLLREIAPNRTLELLASPLNTSERQLGLKMLRVILWGEDFQMKRREDKISFSRKALKLMTADEQVELFEATPPRIMAEPEEVYEASLAYIAAGYTKGRPGMIEAALELLDQLSGGGADGDPLSGVREAEIALERGIANFLLGRYDMALRILLDNGRVDPSIQEFIAENRGGEGDDLTGVFALTENWLVGALLPSYRDSSGSKRSVTLEQWFMRTQRGRFLGTVSNILMTVPRALSRVGATVAETILLPLGRPLGSSIQSAVSSPRLAASAVGFMESIPATEENVADAGYAKTTTTTPEAADPNIMAIKGPEDALTGVDRFQTILTDGIFAAPDRLGDLARTFLFRMRQALGPRSGYRKERPLVAAFLSASVVVGVMLFASSRRLFGIGDLAKAPGVMLLTEAFLSPSQKDRELPKSDLITAHQVKRIVTHWQDCKAQALGNRHAIDKLGDVLSGEMKESWQQKAALVKQQGIFWEYKLHSLELEQITQTARNRAVIITKVGESAKLHGMPQSGKLPSYTTNYRARYTLKKIDDAWKIDQGEVLAE